MNYNPKEPHQAPRSLAITFCVILVIAMIYLAVVTAGIPGVIDGR